MFINDIIKGKYIYMKSVEETDAKFTLDLRLNHHQSNFLSSVNNDLLVQLEWIRKQREKISDYFFVIFNNNNIPIGTNAIYNYDPINNKAEIGRTNMIGNAFESFEAELLTLDFGFSLKNVENIVGEIVATNVSAIKFGEKFGATFHDCSIYKNIEVVKFNITRTKYLVNRKKILKLLRY